MDRKKFPCPCCCKMTPLPDEVVNNGGIATCVYCRYKIKLHIRKPKVVDNPDDIILRKKSPKKSPTVDELLIPNIELTDEEKSAITFEKNDPVSRIKRAWDNLPVKPHVGFKQIDGKPGIEIGIKGTF